MCAPHNSRPPTQLKLRPKPAQREKGGNASLTPASPRLLHPFLNDSQSGDQPSDDVENPVKTGKGTKHANLLPTNSDAILGRQKGRG